MLAQRRALRDVRRKVSSSHWPSSAWRQTVDWLFRTVGLSVHGEIPCADKPWVDSRTITHQSHPQTMSMCVVFGVLRNPQCSSGLSTWQKVVCVPPSVSHHCAVAAVAAARARDRQGRTGPPRAIVKRRTHAPPRPEGHASPLDDRVDGKRDMRADDLSDSSGTWGTVDPQCLSLAQGLGDGHVRF